LINRVEALRAVAAVRASGLLRLRNRKELEMRLMTLISRMILRIALAVFQIVVSGLGNAAGVADPGGTWLTEDGRARVRIERCGAKLEQVCGFIV
jgi:hypothetical protein